MNECLIDQLDFHHSNKFVRDNESISCSWIYLILSTKLTHVGKTKRTFIRCNLDPITFRFSNDDCRLWYHLFSFRNALTTTICPERIVTETFLAVLLIFSTLKSASANRFVNKGVNYEKWFEGGYTHAHISHTSHRTRSLPPETTHLWGLFSFQSCMRYRVRHYCCRRYRLTITHHI